MKKLTYFSFACASALLLVKEASCDDLLDQNDFNAGVILPWNLSESAESNSDFGLKDGELVIHLYDKAVNRWDVQIRHRKLVIQNGHTYNVKFKVRASKATKVYAKIGSQGAPYNEYWNNNWNPISLPANQVVSIDNTFSMDKATDNLCEFSFHIAGDLVSETPVDIFFDDIYLSDTQYKKPAPIAPPPLAVIRVNQVGYLPNAQKHATVISSATSALSWALKNSDNTVVLTGATTVRGLDAASGDNVHTIDFSTFTTPGSNYKLSVTSNGNEGTSHPFAINKNVYSQMKYDALAFFYHQRSGIELKMPYCGRADLARPAGHLPDNAVTAPNTNQPNYSLDVTGGWYDAGDQGKYVVNGGISLWTMLNQYERASLQDINTAAHFADGTMNIPENKNSVPDILDEARWEMDMLLKMQVPDDKAKAGMAHHKMHDLNWTPLATRPDQDKETRILMPPSTAATLNLAAVAAMSSRIYKTIDPTFSAKCLTAAEKAWKAAIANPTVYAPLHKIGGGPYNDSIVTDEFYWAACELYVTTSKDEYKDYLKNSPHYLEMPTVFTNQGEDSGLDGVFTWGSTQGLGTVTLAIIPNGLGASEITKARENIVKSADHFVDILNSNSFYTPLKKYPWGSNSFVLNEAMVMALAYDFKKTDKYFNGVSESMDYLLGRNAMDFSYVSGYGHYSLTNPHHRVWAKQADSTFPSPPRGAISGGPNTGLEDPWVLAAGMVGKTAPQKCYLDNVEAWSVNEVTINWNAPLAWVTAFLDEKNPVSPSSINFKSSKIASAKNIQMKINNKMLSITNNSLEDVSIAITNIAGHCVYRSKIDGAAQKKMVAIPLQSFAKGMYSVVVMGKQEKYVNMFTVVE
ncbi:MAG TPA: glycoside hydrolase family 9 protein [Fibrobacteria bacterium]|nr:glycoside hydrolase family 9 protein [Fibrobacteria bacterium]